MKGMSYIRNFFNLLGRIYRHPAYSIAAVCIAAAVLVFAILLPNVSFLRHTVTADFFTPIQKTRILVSSLGAINTNFTPLSRATTIVISILTSMNITMFVYYIRRRADSRLAGGTGILGTLAGLVGVGCASCGSVLLTSFFGLGATAGFIGFLPLRGAEFGLLGIALLLLSIHALVRKFSRSMICTVDNNPKNNSA
jgi:hypothetical protein